MLFNSLDFAIFLPVVFLLYWFVFNKNLRIQNGFILVASYIFYGWWDWRFLSLILISTFVDYFVGRKLQGEEAVSRRKWLLLTSIVVNLGFLGFFKYYNFFVDSFVSAFTFMGVAVKARTLNIVLPVGISFYTFQTLSYTIDVYRRKLEPTRDFVAFSAFVSFFPQLVAGPIERATHLLPQFYRHRQFDYAKAVDGMRQILWGLFKKMVIADNCAVYVNEVFAQSDSSTGSTLALAVFFFAFQIYGDFSGYSDIAIGTSRLFGFSLMRNFAYPYFSRDIAEFWRRWHISLSTWFRDYLYIPLGGSRVSSGRMILNTFVIFLVSGFWHGANWTFVVWGAVNALYFLPLSLLKKNRHHLAIAAEDRRLPSVVELLQIGVTFALTLIAWVFFRAVDLGLAFSILGKIFSPSLFAPYSNAPRVTFALVAVMVGVEWLQRRRQHGLELHGLKLPGALRWAIYAAVVFLIGMYMAASHSPFIYFQF